MVANGTRRGAEGRASAKASGSRGSPASSDSSEERGSRPCPHAQKAVDAAKLRKAIKKAGGRFSECAKCPPRDPNEERQFEEDDSLWVCLACGAPLCGRNRNKHALLHHETPHTGVHCVVAEARSLRVYCYMCDSDVPLGAGVGPQRKLKDALEALRHPDSARSSPESQPESGRYYPSKMYPSTPPAAPAVESGLPGRRVRGLSNLGNTCFFNSVLQCLVQTPYLVDVLREMSAPGQKFRLSGGNMKFKPSEKKRADDDDDNDDEDRSRSEDSAEREIPLSPINGELAEWGDFTETLTETLQELQISGKYDVFSPSKLFKKLETKVPQFAGGDQHDSHELLRHLLEAVRSEDLNRYKLVILRKLGLDSKEKRLDIDEETKQKVKFYGNQASDAMLRPGQVFRGMLVSTLQCQDCHYSSHTTEHFLDLSLPITADKPQPPAVTRRKAQDEQLNNLDSSEHDKSKNSNSKDKQGKKYRKNKKGGAHNHAAKSKDSNQNGDITNENKIENKSSSEQSDADVEDNVEENSKHQDDSNYSQQRDTASNFSFFTESGYNSEKVISSDSIRSSPVDTANIEKSDISPERPDKDVEDNKLNLPSTVIALPYKNFTADESSQPSNPDSGVASPETAKHALSDTANVESPITSKELGSPTSLSSEINMDISSPRQSNNSPVCTEMDRPISRISFNDSNNQKAVNFENALPLNDTIYMNADNEPDSSEDKLNKINSGLENINFNSTSYDQKIKQNTLTLNVSDNQDILNGYGLNGPQRLTSPENDSPKWKSSNRMNTVSPRYQYDEGEISIQTCLNQFTSSELLTGSNKVGCEACTKRANNGKTVYTNATKRFLISSPPAVLIIHLKRFQLGPRCILRKLTKAVNFPTVLDIAPFCSEKVKTLPNVSPNQSKILYSLYGVVEHSGGMHLGHYVAYVKVRSEVKAGDPRWKFLPTTIEVDGQEVNLPDILNGLNNVNDNDTDSSLSGYESGEGAIGGTDVESPDGKWFYISDSRVLETTEEKVLKVQAYLLFYERIL